MELSIIDLVTTEVSDSSTELIDKLQKNSFKWNDSQVNYYAQKVLEMLSQKSYDSIIDNINNLSQEDIIFMEGNLYNFSFTYPSMVYSGTTVRMVYNQNVKISGLALATNIEHKDNIEFMGQRYKPFIAKTEAELIGVIYSLSNDKRQFNHYVPTKFSSTDIDSSFKPLYPYKNKGTPLFGYGKWVDTFTAKNLDLKTESDIKSFELIANIAPIEAYKQKLIESIYFNQTGKQTSYKDIPAPEKIYEEHVTKKEDTMATEEHAIIEEPALEVDFAMVGKRFNFGEQENKSLDKDIYFKAKEMISYVFKTDNTSFIKEISRVTDIVLRKILLKKEQFKTADSESNFAQFELLKYIYITGCIHKIQHVMNIKVTDGKVAEFFIKTLFDKARTYINSSGLSTADIEKTYWNALVKVDQVLNDNNILIIQKKEKVYSSSLEQYKRVAGLIASKNPIVDDEYEMIEDDIYKSIVEKINAPFKKHVKEVRRYRPSILSINAPNKTAREFIRMGELKVNSDFESFDTNKFYEYYTNGCPKGIVHEWVNDKCKLCSVSRAMIEEKDKKYYQIHKKDFEKHKPKFAFTLIIHKPLPLVNDLPDTKGPFLKGRLDELVSKYKVDKIPLLNLTRNNTIPLTIAKTKVIESVINKTNIHRLKFYLSYYGVSVNIFNNAKSNDDLFIAMFYALLGKVDKDGLKSLIEYDLKFSHQEIEIILAKKKTAVKTGEQMDMDPNFEHIDEEKQEGDGEGIDYEVDENDDLDGDDS